MQFNAHRDNAANENCCMRLLFQLQEKVQALLRPFSTKLREIESDFEIGIFRLIINTLRII